MRKRLFDIVVVLLALPFLMPFIILTFLMVKISSKGPALYWSRRVGINNKLFDMPKFRSMKIDTPVVATHLLNAPEQYLTPIGSFLRESSLDELPQLLCILNGEMSVVGPRPALFNQYDLIHLRNEAGVEKLRPGLTGWAQINGRDELPIPNKVALDVEYLHKRSITFDLVIMINTIKKVICKDSIKH